MDIQTFRRMPARELFERTLKWPELRIDGYKSIRWKHKQNWIHTMRQALDRASFVNISRDLVRAAVGLAWKLPPDRLMNAMAATRHPWPVVIYEFPWGEKAYAQRDLGIAGKEPGAGTGRAFVLIIQEPESGDSTIIQIVFEEESKFHMGVLPFAWHWSNEGHPLPKNMVGGSTMRELTQKLPTAKHLQAHYLFSSPYLKRYPEFVEQLDTDPRVECSLNGPLAWKLQEIALESSISKQGFNAGSFWQAATGDTGGEFRFLCGLFSILSRPTILRYSQQAPAPQVDRGKRSQQDSREYQVRLLFPHEKVVNLLSKTPREGKPLAWEITVGEYWHYSHKRGDEACDHIWPSDSMRRQFCTKCGKLRWRFPAHTKGKGKPRKAPKVKVYDFSGVKEEEGLAHGNY